MRKKFLSVVIACATTLLSTIACDSATGPVDPIGSYTLTAVNGTAVPFATGSLLSGTDTANMNRPGCLLTITGGTLVLSSYRQNFTLAYETTDSCNFSSAPITSGGEGTYEIRGNAIDFRLHGSTGVTFVGTISRRRIEVPDTPYALTYTR